MAHFVKLVDMKLGDDDKKVDPAPASDCPGPAYPYGLCLSLTEREVEKLDLDSDAEVGDVIHIMAMARLTSKSERQDADGKTRCRYELQIEQLGLEDENAETDSEERAERRYGGKD